MALRSQKNRFGPGRDQLAPSFADLRSVFDPVITTWRTWSPKVALIIAATLWIYWPALRGDFIWDDDWYITTNPLLRDTTGLWKFWFQPGSWVEYYPVHETVLWLQWQIWGNATLGYHLTNFFLHLVNALLVWRLLTKFNLQFAWLGGLIFAVHPAQVESVAWIAELKNTLSTPFFLLAMSCWIDYEASKRREDYQWSLLLFVIGMLCKITLAPFPVIILLYAWWKKGRIEWSDLKGAAPFAAVSLVLGTATLWVGKIYAAQSHTQATDIPIGGFFTCVARAGEILAYYFSASFVPLNLAPIHQKWTTSPGSFTAWLPWLILAAALALLWKKSQSWGRHVLLGLGFFGLNLVPFLGYPPVSYMLYSWVEDQLLYLPIIGLIGLVIAGLGDLDQKLRGAIRLLPLGVIAFAIVFMTMIARAYAGWYVNEETLWTSTLEHYPKSWIAHYDLGNEFLKQRRYDEALLQFQQAIPLLPGYADTYYNLGVTLDKLGRVPEAQTAYHEALGLNPGDPKIYLNLGQIEHRAGHNPEAEALFRQGLKAVPGDPSLTIDLGDILIQSGRVAEALDLYQQAVAIHPDVAPLQYNLGVTLLRTGNLSGASDHLSTAVNLDPTIPGAHENLGIALAQLGHVPEAIGEFQAALQLNPKLLAARTDLGMALARTGHIPEAIAQFQKVLEIDPGNATARNVLAKLQQFELQQNPTPSP